MNNSGSKENDFDEKTCLYVGNLSLKTLESDVYRLFRVVGELKLVKLIRPTNDHFYFKPTAYAYVTYANEEDASKAIEKLNFYTLNGMQIRVMYCDKSKLKNESANVVIKNLPPEVDDKTLYDSFKIFGKILSVKVSMHNGKSMGYGYIQFAEKISAKKCIKIGSGLTMSGVPVEIEKYEKKKVNETSFTNVYIKNFPLTMNEVDLMDLLSSYGEIDSFHFPYKECGNPKGFAFCNFASPDSAKKAIEELHNNYDLFNLPEPFYIQKAQSRSEREIELRSQLAKLALEGKNFKRNLYITNIPFEVTEEEFEKVFEKFGKVISCTLEVDSSKVSSKMKFGYVCYSKPEEAHQAMVNACKISFYDKEPIISFFKCKREREKERESNSLFYSPALVHAPRSNYFLERRNDSTTEARLYDDLFKQLASVAQNYEDKWPQMGVKSKSEFASQVCSMLLKKPKNEIRNMIELTNVLMDNVNSALKEYPENQKK